MGCFLPINSAKLYRNLKIISFYYCRFVITDGKLKVDGKELNCIPLQKFWAFPHGMVLIARADVPKVDQT